MKIATTIQLPYLWHDAIFQRNEWQPLTYLVGPNGSGKTGFAEQLKRIWAGVLRPRYLSADRLVGLDRAPNTNITLNHLTSGINLDAGHSSQYRNYGEMFGFATDAWLILREKIDVRVRIEALLSRMFNRNLRLAEEGGYLKPKLQRSGIGSAEYVMREAECHGLKELICLLTFLYDDTYNCLIFDEPEMHLHPQLQQFLLAEIRKVAGDPGADPSQKCFVLITHSSYMVDIRTLDELANVIVFQPNQLPMSIGALDANDTHRIRRALPRLNTHHKQFFFATRPIFVEGHTDQQFFALVQDLRRRPIAASGVSIIDVGGKEEVDTFYRICERIHVKAHVIVDFDVIFGGQLRQTVSADPDVQRFIQDAGVGSDLMQVIGTMERALADITVAVTGLGEVDAKACIDFVRLVEAVRAEKELDKRRRVLFLGIQRIRSSLEEHLQDQRGRIALVAGIASNILKAFALARVHVLPAGEVEHYFSSQVESPYGKLSERQKQTVFLEERDRLLAPMSDVEIAERYARILPFLDAACGDVEVDVASFVLAALGDWIHNVQTSYKLKQFTDAETLKSVVRVQWATYQRMISIVSFLAEGPDGFQCTVRLLPMIDPQQRYLCFSNNTVPAQCSLSTTA